MQHPKDLRKVAGSVYTGTEVGICIFFAGAFRCSEGRAFVYCIGKRGGGWEGLGAEDFGGSRNFQGEWRGDQLSQTEYKGGGGLLTANVEGRGGGS